MEEIEKLPPQSIEAEKALLGALMLDPDGITKVIDLLLPEDFYKISHQKIYSTMRDLFEKKEPIDLLTLTQRLEEKRELENVGGASYLGELISQVPTPSHILHYSKLIKEKKILRDLIKASEEISKLAFSQEKDIDLILDEAESKIFSISQKNLTQEFSPLKEELESAFSRIERIHSQKEALRGVTTGFPSLDEILAGFQNGDLILLAARPSLGKSALSLDLARACALKEKKPVGIFSLEMSKEQVVDRLIAAEAGVSLWKLRTGKLSEEDFSRLQEAFDRLSQSPIFIEDSAITTILQMRAAARRLQAQMGLGLLIVDYLQLITPRNEKESTVQQITEISRGLKSLAKELNIPVLAISQLSRAVEHRSDQKPRLSDLRESGSLEQDSDVVLFIWREDKVNPSTVRKNIADIIIAKHRNGPVGSVELYFDEETISFKEIEKGFEAEAF